MVVSDIRECNLGVLKGYKRPSASRSEEREDFSIRALSHPPFFDCFQALRSASEHFQVLHSVSERSREILSYFLIFFKEVFKFLTIFLFFAKKLKFFAGAKTFEHA
jgi:hypothetical protein